MANNTRRLRAVQVSFHRDRTGRAPDTLLRAWPTLTDVAEATAGAGADLAVVQAADRDATVELNGVSYHFVRDLGVPLPRNRRFLVIPRRLTKRVRSMRPEVVHVHGFLAPIATRFLARSVPTVPLMVQDHGGLAPQRWRRVASMYGYRKVSAACFTAQEQAEPYRDAGVLGPHVRIFSVPESSTHFTPGIRREAELRMGVYGTPCIAWIGRLNRNKDPLTVLEAFALASRSLPDPHLWCCYTEAPLLESVRKRVAEDPRLTHRVHLRGRIPHSRVEQLLRASDFLMLGSHREGSGYAVLEALACGVTPVVTDIPSFRRLTDGGRIGSITPPGDARAMAAALCQWWGVSSGARRERVLEFFARELSFAAVGRRLRGVYQAMVAGS